MFKKKKIMNNLFRLEVDTGSGGYGFTDTYAELLEDVEYEYGKEIKEEVEKWALNSKENEEFRKYKMYILNMGNEECINYRGV